jgi:hypothetical protein
MDPWLIVRDEFFELQSKLIEEDTETNRRILIKSVCSYSEALLNYLMSVISDNCGWLEPHEKLAFSEKQINVKDSGEISTKLLMVNTKTKLKMVFKLLLRFLEDYPSPFEGANNAGYVKLCNSISLRDKLTHPRGERDLAVSQEQTQEALDGYKWFIAHYQEMQSQISALTQRST